MIIASSDLLEIPKSVLALRQIFLTFKSNQDQSMADYFPGPFPFLEIMKKQQISKLDLESSIRANLRSLILLRTGEFAYDREQGFDMWDYDKQVFYHEREPYYETKNEEKGQVEGGSALKHFKADLKRLIEENEIRLRVSNVQFNFKLVHGNRSVYQRKIVLEVGGRIKSTGKMLTPPFRMTILYTPFMVESS